MKKTVIVDEIHIFCVRSFLTCLLSFCFAAVGWMVTPEITEANLVKDAMLFPGWLASALQPEPQERAAVMFAILSLPLCWYVVFKLPLSAKVCRAAGGFIGIAFFIFTLYSTQTGASKLTENLLNFNWPNMVCMVLAILAILWLEKNTRPDRDKGFQWYYGLAIIPAVLQVYTTRIYMPEYVNYVDIRHFGLISQYISNAANNFLCASQYGFFALFLNPWFSVFGLSVISISAVMGVLFLAVMSGAFYVVFKLIHHRWLIFVLACCMVFVSNGYISLHKGDFDPYFQYHPIRTLEPMLVLLWGYWGCANKIRQKHWIVSGAILAALGVFWNLDSGIICVAAMSLWLFWGNFCQKKPQNWPGFWLFFAVFAVCFGGILYLIGFDEFFYLFKYQQIFVLNGFYMLPMPQYPHFWLVVLCGQFIIWGWSGRNMFYAPKNRTAKMLFLISSLGIGLFLYYQGRSVNDSLIAVSWLFLLAIIILFDYGLRLKRLGIVAVEVKSTVLLLTVCTGILTGNYLADLPLSCKLVSNVTGRLLDRKPEYYQDFKFIQELTPPDKIANIVGTGQGFYSAQTQVKPGFLPYNQVECILKSDYQKFLQGLVESRRPMFIIKRRFQFEWEPPQEFIDKFFDLKLTSPSGRVKYYLPKGD